MRNGNEATVDIKDIKKGDAVSVFMTQVAAVSCAATQVPETRLPIHNFLKVGLRNALQVEAVSVVIADSIVPRSQCISVLFPLRSSLGKDFRSHSRLKVSSELPIFGTVEL